MQPGVLQPGVSRGLGQGHPGAEGHAARARGRRAHAVQPVGSGDDHAAFRRHVVGLADAFGQHVVAGAGQGLIAATLFRPSKIGFQIGAADFDLVDDRLQPVFARGVANGVHVGPQLQPGIARFGEQGQALVGNPAGAHLVVGNPLHQGFVLGERCAVARLHAGKYRQAGIGDAQGFKLSRHMHPLQQTGHQQVDLQCVLTRPAGGSIHRPQATVMANGECGRVSSHAHSVRERRRARGAITAAPSPA